MTVYHWQIKREYYEQLENGLKSIVIRVGYPQTKRVFEGDYVTFDGYEDNLFYVLDVEIFDSFQDMLLHERVERVMPYKTKSEALCEYRRLYSPKQEHLGVYAFTLCDAYMHMRSLGDYNIHLSDAADEYQQKSYNKLSRTIMQGYVISNSLTKDYYGRYRHYYSKVVPGIFDGTRNIMICRADNNPCGVITLKKTPEEKKICSLYVAKSYRHQGVGCTLLEAGFEWLGTVRPVITMGESKVKSFATIIEHYGWRHTSTLPIGYYNRHSREFVFNEGV